MSFDTYWFTLQKMKEDGGCADEDEKPRAKIPLRYSWWLSMDRPDGCERIKMNHVDARISNTQHAKPITSTSEKACCRLLVFVQTE